MFHSRRPADDEAWTATVVQKTRRLPDGANMYHYLEIVLDHGPTRKVRVDRDLWEAVSADDRIVKRPGRPPARETPPGADGDHLPSQTP